MKSGWMNQWRVIDLHVQTSKSGETRQSLYAHYVSRILEGVDSRAGLR